MSTACLRLLQIVGPSSHPLEQPSSSPGDQDLVLLVVQIFFSTLDLLRTLCQLIGKRHLADASSKRFSSEGWSRSSSGLDKAPVLVATLDLTGCIVPEKICPAVVAVTKCTTCTRLLPLCQPGPRIEKRIATRCIIADCQRRCSDCCRLQKNSIDCRSREQLQDLAASVNCN